MQKITPHLWFDKQAREAAEFYISIFPDSKITSSQVLKDTPSGDAETVNLKIWGYDFMAISAGPYFKLNPGISFMVNFDPSRDPDAKTRIDEIWGKLAEGGKVLMPIDKYPFSERYGWVEDKYGVSWQLILTKPEGEERPIIIPSFLFTKDKDGQAREAGEFWTSVFKNSKKGTVVPYPAGMEPNKEGNVMFSEFKLEDQWFVAMDGGPQHDFKFNEAISFIVNCKDQTEVDYYWEKLSAVPEAEQCGWLKDKFGVSWQIIPSLLGELMGKGTAEQRQRVTQAFLKMKKFDIVELQRAFDGN